MSIVTIRNVEWFNPEARFLDQYEFRVTFQCISSLENDVEWKLIYVSSSSANEEFDQVLDECAVGPVPVGLNSFDFVCKPPDPSKLEHEEVLGVGALILTGSYNEQEFVRVGYYQNTEYDNEEMKENPPKPFIPDRLVRDISKKPRVTRFQIKWDVAPARPGQLSAAGAAASSAVPSANDLASPDDGSSEDMNGISS